MSIKDNPGIAGTKLFVYYDTSVFSVDPEKDIEKIGSFKSEGTLVPNSTEVAKKNGRYDGDLTKDGIIIVWASTTDVVQDGAFFEITLHADKDSANGSYDIQVEAKDGKTCNQNIEPVVVKGSKGTVKLSGGSDDVKKQEIATSVSGNDRLQDSIILRIGNYGAVTYGALKAIDKDNYDVTPIINSNDRTLVPIRFVAESLGAEVSWSQENRQVSIEMEDKLVVMTIGSTNYTINGKDMKMDTAPEIVDSWGRTMVPIRFVAEALGMSVEWDGVNRMVLITPVDRPWILDGPAEAEAISEVYQLMMLQSFL